MIIAKNNKKTRTIALAALYRALTHLRISIYAILHIIYQQAMRASAFTFFLQAIRVTVCFKSKLSLNSIYFYRQNLCFS
jgi:hypothetical protein